MKEVIIDKNVGTLYVTTDVLKGISEYYYHIDLSGAYVCGVNSVHGKAITNATGYSLLQIVNYAYQKFLDYKNENWDTKDIKTLEEIRALAKSFKRLYKRHQKDKLGKGGFIGKEDTDMSRICYFLNTHFQEDLNDDFKADDLGIFVRKRK